MMIRPNRYATVQYGCQYSCPFTIRSVKEIVGHFAPYILGMPAGFFRANGSLALLSSHTMHNEDPSLL